MTADKPIAAQIVELIGAEGLDTDTHLRAQWLADRLRVSRSPVNEALRLLHDKGLVRHEPNRGYFLARPITDPAPALATLGVAPVDVVTQTYFRVADDRLRGLLPDERGVRFHETLVEGSGNPFFIDTIRRVNRVRRLLSYRSMQDRKRYKQHCRQHLELLELLEHERNEEAAACMREHLQSTLKNLTKIRNLLKP